MRGYVVVVAAFAAVLCAAPRCLAGSLDSSSSESGARSTEVTSGLLSSDLGNSKAESSSSSREEAMGTDQTPSAKLTILLNDPSQLAAAPGSGATPAPASSALPGATAALGMLDPGTLPGNPQNSSGPSGGLTCRNDDGLANLRKKPSADNARGAGTGPIAGDGLLLTPQVTATGSGLGDADTFSLSFDAATDKPSSPARRAPRSGVRRTTRPARAFSEQPAGAAARSCVYTLGLLGLAALPLAARRRRHGSA